MAIPDFQSIMLPLLNLMADKQIWRLRDAVNQLAGDYKLTEEERAALLPSGRAPLFYNRVAWAKTHLAKAGVVASVSRGQMQITDRGLSLLAENPTAISLKTLQRFPEFVKFRDGPVNGDAEIIPGPIAVSSSEETVPPEEQLEQAHSALVSTLISDVVDMLKSSTPLRFEQIVVDVITSMGYGGSRQEAGKAIGKSGDEGIDGIINEDRLGLDTIYLQAKRWENPVGRPEIQKFVGALAGQQASKGIFITTSAFTREAEDYARKIPQKVILLNGAQLARLMIEHNVGVSTVATYELKKIDSDYFADE
jgi:restriction system protein